VNRCLHSPPFPPTCPVVPSLPIFLPHFPQMPIGKVSIYRLLFVCVCVCTVMNFSNEDKASGVKFCTAVHRRPWQGISHFGELCAACGHRIGICGYASVPKDGRTCFPSPTCLLSPTSSPNPWGLPLTSFRGPRERCGLPSGSGQGHLEC